MGRNLKLELIIGLMCVSLAIGWFGGFATGKLDAAYAAQQSEETSTTSPLTQLVHVDYEIALPNGSTQVVNLVNDRPDQSGRIVVSYIPGFVAEEALRKDQVVTKNVIQQFGSTEESGKGR
jgi:hypothetical protein